MFVFRGVELVRAPTVEQYARGSGTWIQNLFITISSVVGTLAWGFGDVAARHLPDYALWFARKTAETICPNAQKGCEFSRLLLSL